MTKTGLIEKIKARLADNTNTKHIHEKTVISAVLDALGEVAAESLASGGEAPLPGLGKLYPHERPARKGRNPRTGVPLDIAGSRTVKFGPGTVLMEAVNGRS
jgi:nucleoid DNA-binding protein